MNEDLDLTLMDSLGNMVRQPSREVQNALIDRMRNGDPIHPITCRRICIVEPSPYLTKAEADDWAKRIAIALNAFRGVPTERLQEVADRARVILRADDTEAEAQL